MRSLSDIFRRLPPDGQLRYRLRNFNFSPRLDGRAKSVADLARSLGFDVRRTRLSRGMSGRLVTDPFAENGYCVEINTEQSITAQRWAVLHEMGHYYLHVDKSDPLAEPMHLDRSGVTFYLDSHQEDEANAFAATLLFGDGALKAALALHGGNVERVARYFGVSEQAVRIGARDFCGVTL